MPRPARATRPFLAWIRRITVVALVACAAALVTADPYAPFWGAGSGPAVHFAPIAWPADGNWQPYTKLSSDIEDRSNNDGSNGGTSPQSYVNVSSGCTDETLPSVYYAYDAPSEVLFFRWRVLAPPHNYATGPNPGTFGATSPWSSALWTVFIDINGDGYRDFAVHLDGSSGGPATAVDRIAAIWSPTKSQSLDYVTNPQIHLIAHNPTAFVDGPAGTDRLLNFHGTLSPSALWPNGAAETEWDYGTTRATKLNTGCGEYFIDYQIPLAMLDATAVGGPKVTPTTPMSLFFATANSLNNPLQKDVVVSGDFLADPSRPVPGGDTITPAGGVVAAPIVQSLTATGCGTTTLTATVLDTLDDAGGSTIATVEFLAYADTNGDGAANDGNTWIVAASGSPGTTIGRWTATWNTAGQPAGRYVLGVRAIDQQGNTTYSFLDQAAVNSTYGTTPPHFANATGLVVLSFANACGTPGASIAIAASPSTVGAGGTVTFTISVTNPLAQPVALSSIAAALPPGFTYQSTTGGTLTPATSPTGGAGGSLPWTFAATAIPAAGTGTLIFTATASASAGTFSATATADVAAGTITSAPATIAVGSPALTIGKAASVGSAAPGDPVTYTITYSNDSAAGVTAAVITDVLPEGLDFVSASHGGSYAAGTRTVTWTVGDVAAGAGPFAVSLATTVTSPYPVSASTPVVNTAAITSTETSATNASSAVYVDAPRARLAVQIVAPVTLVAYDTTLTYTLSYANVGQAPAPGTTLTLPVPAGWTFVSALNGGSHSAGTVTWSLGTLAAGATGSTQVTLRTGPAVYTGSNPTTATTAIASPGVGVATNSYTVGLTGLGNVCSTYYFRDLSVPVGAAGSQRIANTTATVLADAGATAINTSPGSATEVELVTFYQDPATSNQVDFNGQISSNMWVSRSGGAPAVVTGYVYDHNPATGAETMLGSGSSSFNGNTVTLFAFNVPVSGTLAAGHRLRWRYSFHSQNTNSSVSLSVLYGGGVGGTLRDSNSQFCVTAPATPVIDTDVDRLVASPGDALVYTTAFANTGATGMTTSQIAFTLPAGVAFTSATLNGSPVSPSSAGQVHTFAVQSTGGAAGTVVGGGSGTLVVHASLAVPFTGAGSALVGQAALSSTQTSPVVDSATTALFTPSLTVTKTADDTLVGAGDVVTYAIEVLNGGLGSAAGVVVSDVLPITGYYTFVPGSARLNGVVVAPDPVGAGTLTVPVGTLAPGASARVTFQMQVAASGVPAGITPRPNVAEASSTSVAGTSTSDTATIAISTNPNLTLSKTSAPATGPIAPGSMVTYTLTVANTGSAEATGVRVVDPVPADTAFIAGSMQHGAALTDAADGDAGTFDGAANRVAFAAGTLGPGASETFVYEVVVVSPLAAGSIAVGSTATATAENAGPRTASASIVVEASPILTLAKSAPASLPFPATTLAAPAAASTSITVASPAGLTIGGTVVVGGVSAVVQAIADDVVTLDTPVTGAQGNAVHAAFEYRLEYGNGGTAAATGVVVVDTLPAGLAVIAVSAGGNHTTGTVTWPLGTVPAGAGGMLGVLVYPTAAGSYANQATLTSVEATPVSSNTVSTRVGSIVVSKATTTPATTHGAGTYQVATYVITVANQDPATAATGVTVSDQLPAGFSFELTDALTGATATTSPVAGDTRPTWTGLDIAPGDTVTLTFTARIGNVAPGVFQNEVMVSGSSLPVVGFDALATTAEDVTVASILGTTGIPAVTPTILPGDTLAVSLADLDLDTDPAIVETVVVSLVNQRTSEQEDVTLTETGASTGIFAGTLGTVDSPLGGTDFSAPMHVQVGDDVSVLYQDAFTGSGLSGTAAALAQVTSAANVPPEANDDSAVVAEDAAATAVDVLANDSTAPDTGETLTITAVTQGDLGGAVTITGGGTGLAYQPAADVFGQESFTYTVADGHGGTDTATVVMTVTAVNDDPSATADAVVANRSVPASFYLLWNDTIAPDSGEALAVVSVTQGVNGGSVTVAGDHSHVIYTAPSGIGAADTFTYTISDGNGGTDTATVTVTMNTPPTANADSAAVGQDSGITAINVLANDTFLPDTGEYLFIYDVSAGSAGGVIDITGCGTMIEYTPPAGFTGTETFTYTIRDSHQAESTAVVTVTVGDPNDPPTAAADTATVARDAAATAVAVLDNDSTAPDTGETLTISAVTPGSQGGTVAITGGGTGLTYAPAPGFSGTETFTYTVQDGRGGTATATVTVTVTGAAYRRYFSEGLNNASVATHISLANPAMVARPVHLEFYRQGQTPVLHDLTLGPRARITIDTRTIPGLAAAAFATAIEAEATVVAERTLSWDFGEPGTSLEHAVEPSTTWYFAEGATTGGFSLFYLLMNPGSVPATAIVDFLPQVGPPVQRTYTLAPRTRFTVPVNTVAASLASADLGAAVHADQPIVVERSLYLSTPSTTWVAGTTGAGVTQPRTQWFFGEGSVGPFFDAWILLANPGTAPATAQVRYLSENGQTTVTTHTVPVGRRITIRVADDAPALFASSFGVVVTATNGQPIIAERAMWWPNDGSGWYEGHVAAGLPGTGHAWGIADGIAAANGDSETYVLIANTSTRSGVVRVTTVFDDGTPAIEHDVTVAAEARMTLRMRTFQPEVVGKRFSVFVEAQGPSPIDLVVEHSSYSHTTVFWGAGSSAPASPIH